LTVLVVSTATIAAQTYNSLSFCTYVIAAAKMASSLTVLESLWFSVTSGGASFPLLGYQSVF
jgi:hypothetical protein